jgi:NodT family efflux transporter outer membrane factor (OMF) lipoprotein
MATLHRCLVVAGALTLLSGCVVGPNFVPPTADLPPAWSQAALGVNAAASSDDAWWTVFGDPELGSLVDRAQAGNLATRQAVLRIDEARAERRAAAAGAWPQVSVGGAYQNSRISERTALTSLFATYGAAARGAAGALGGVPGALPTLNNPFDLYQWGADASWELDLFGRVRRTVEAADASTEAAVQDSRAVRVALSAEVAAAYVELRGAQALRRLSEARLATARDLLRLAEQAREADLGGDQDIADAKAAVASAEAVLPPLQAQETLDRNQLALLLAENPGALETELAAPAPLPAAPRLASTGLPSDLARRRPDIRRAEAELHAAVAMQGVAVADLYPRVVLQASGGYQASHPGDLTSWAAHYLTVGPTLDLPLFDAGRRRANIQLQDVRAKEAALAYAQTVLGALHEVEDAMAVYGRERARLVALQTVVDQQNAAFDLAHRRYAAGSSAFREVLANQDRLQAAQLAQVQSAMAADEDLVALYRALGGGWEAPAAGGPA